MNAIVPVEAERFMPVLSVAQAVERRAAMVEYVQTLMVEGVDFGTIPGSSKPSLYKPGAEKLCTLFGMVPQFTILEKVLDWNGTEYGDPFFYVHYQCRMMRGGAVVGEGEGSCNAWESKYRWR